MNFDRKVFTYRIDHRAPCTNPHFVPTVPFNDTFALIFMLN